MFATRDVEFAPSDASLIIASGELRRPRYEQGRHLALDRRRRVRGRTSTTCRGCAGGTAARTRSRSPRPALPAASRSGSARTAGSPTAPTPARRGRASRRTASPAASGTCRRETSAAAPSRSTCAGTTVTDDRRTGARPAPPSRPARTRSTTGRASCRCSLATSPQDPNTVYMSFFSGLTPPPGLEFCVPKIVESDGRRHDLAEHGGNLSQNNCRNPWIVTHPDIHERRRTVSTSTSATAWPCATSSATRTATPRCSTSSGSWANALAGQHTDPTDIVFDTAIPNGCPILYSGDGGIFSTNVAPASCASSFGWDDANFGNHGWDIRGFAGTVNAGSTDLYFGTQDNGIYYTGDGGATYTRQGPGRVRRLRRPQRAGARAVAELLRLRLEHLQSGGHRHWSASRCRPETTPANSFLATQFGPRSYAFMTATARARTTSGRST